MLKIKVAKFLKLFIGTPLCEILNIIFEIKCNDNLVKELFAKIVNTLK